VVCGDDDEGVDVGGDFGKGERHNHVARVGQGFARHEHVVEHGQWERGQEVTHHEVRAENCVVKLMAKTEREKEREKDREREKETDRPTDRQQVVVYGEGERGWSRRLFKRLFYWLVLALHTKSK
jgi:hypothetical protein